MNLSSAQFIARLDFLIRFFLYVLIFWLPYSPAVVEICVIVSFLLFVLKRSLLLEWSSIRHLPLSKKFRKIVVGFLPRQNFLNKPIGIFFCICLLSILGSEAPLNSLHRFITKTFEWFVVYFLFLEAFYEKNHVHKAWGIFLLTSFAVVLDGFWQYYVTGTDFFRHQVIARGGATASFHHPNSLAVYLLFLIPLVFVWAKFRRNSILRIIGLLFCGAAIWLLFLTFSRGAVIALFVGAMSYLIMVNKRLGLGLLFGGILCFGVLCVLPQELRDRIRLSSLDLSITFNWRIHLWYDIVSLIRFKPFLGYGINNFMPEMQTLGEHIRGHEFYYSPMYAHNCFLQMAFETGLLGLGAFCLILMRFFKETIRSVVGAINKGASSRWLLGGLVIGVASFLAHSFVDTDFYSLQLAILFWFMVGLSVSIIRLVAEENLRTSQ